MRLDLGANEFERREEDGDDCSGKGAGEEWYGRDVARFQWWSFANVLLDRAGCRRLLRPVRGGIERGPAEEIVPDHVDDLTGHAHDESGSGPSPEGGDAFGFDNVDEGVGEPGQVAVLGMVRRDRYGGRSGERTRVGEVVREGEGRVPCRSRVEARDGGGARARAAGEGDGREVVQVLVGAGSSCGRDGGRGRGGGSVSSGCW